MRIVRELVSVLALMGLDGCSFIGVHGPGSPLLENARSAGVRSCTDDYGLPGIDAIVTALSILIGAEALTETDYSAGLVGIPLVLPYAISSVYGFDQVRDCKIARSETDPKIARRHELAVDAWKLANAAISASRNGHCVTVKRLAPQIKQLDANLHATVIRDADVARCLDAPDTVETPAATPYCFDETSDGLPATICMPSEFSCHSTVSGLPPASIATACLPSSAGDVTTRNQVTPRAAVDPAAAEEARLWIQSAAAAMTAGQYDDAAHDFGAAYEIVHDPELLQQIANANVGAGKCTSAAAYYERYLREAKPDAHGVATTRERIASCKASP